MMNKIKILASLYRELGLRWSAFRLAYAFRLRSGLIRLQMPQYKWSDRPLATWLKKGIPSESIAYAEWRKANAPKFFFDKDIRPERSDERFSRRAVEEHWDKQPAVAEADRILNGEIKFFAHEFQQTGFPPNWHKDNFSHVTLSDSEGSLSQSSETLRSRRAPPQSDTVKHWSQISDSGEYVIARRVRALPDEAIPTHEETASAKNKNASQRHTDIKFTWEANRFGMVYTLVRAYSATNDEKYSEAFWTLISDWAEHNPPNTGTNWKDGQEIALRLMAWTFGFYQFSYSPSATPHRISELTTFVAAQAERIYKNIGYAISTRSNHTISEAFCLWMVGLLFPELKDSNKYLFFGQVLLEDQAAKQIFPDGSYSMYSLNYHRFILHLYLYAIRLGELNQDNPSLRAAFSAAKQSPTQSARLLRADEHRPRNDGIVFSDSLKNSIAKSIAYLSHLIDPSTGQMPVYGSNDGALVLPLNNCDFTDYRPLLQLGSVITTGKPMFEPGEWDEDVFWLCGESPLSSRSIPEGGSRERARVREKPQSSFPNGGTYILRGINSKAIILCTDYQSRPSHADQLHVDLWIHGHNIACDAGTYLYSGEGIWRNGLARTSAHNTLTVDGKDQMSMASRFTWTDWAKGKVLQNGENIWVGEHDGYKPVIHKRMVMLLDGDRWLVVDHLDSNESHHYALHWLLSDGHFKSLDSGVLVLAPAHSDSKLSESRVLIQTGLTQGEAKFSTVRADPNSARGWRSRYYGHKEPAISLLIETNRPKACFWTFFGFENDMVECVGNILKVNDVELRI